MQAHTSLDEKGLTGLFVSSLMQIAHSFWWFTAWVLGLNSNLWVWEARQQCGGEGIMPKGGR
jgi:hypothetical protein